MTNRSLASSWVVDALGRTAKAPVGSLGRAAQGQGTAGVVSTSFFVNDVVSQMTVADASRLSWELDPLQRVSRVKRESFSGGVWVGAADTVSHYDADGDEPSWVHEETSDPFAVSRYVEDPSGAWSVDLPGLRLSASLEFGAPLDLTTARAVVSAGTAGNKQVARYGWHGGEQRSTGRMVRLEAVSPWLK